eukprot:SAG11_NODE_1320_length_5208_cov_5.188687_5_plen_82_part_00
MQNTLKKEQSPPTTNGVPVAGSDSRVLSLHMLNDCLLDCSLTGIYKELMTKEVLETSDNSERVRWSTFDVLDSACTAMLCA